MTAGRFALRVVVLELLVVAGTVWLGWWSVPVLALGYGLADRASRLRGTVATVALIIAWLEIIAFGARAGWSHAARAGAVAGASPTVLLVVTLAFGVLLAGPAAVVGGWIGDRTRRGGRATVTGPTPYPPGGGCAG